MNLHETADNLVAAIGGLYGDGTKLFREGTSSPHVSEVVAETKVELGPLSSDDPLETEREFLVPASYGTFSTPARFIPVHWYGPEHPTLIYHHGSGESKYTARLRRIAGRIDRHRGTSGREAGLRDPMANESSRPNIIACSVPYNNSLKEYLYGAARLDRWLFLLAASAHLTEKLTTYLTDHGCTRVVCAGISLGGWVTNLHHTYFDTCNVYTPIFAGAALDDLFTESIYRKLLASSAKEDHGRFRATLNFERDFNARGDRNVFPVMARFDQFIRYHRQSGIYQSGQINVLERSHTTGAVAYKRLGQHLWTHLDTK